MSATAAAGDRVLEQRPLSVEIGLAPLRIHVRRAGRRLLRALTVWACEGEVRDRFVQVTEGVIADERLGFPERVVAATVAAEDAHGGADRPAPQRRAPGAPADRARRRRARDLRARGRGRAAAPRDGVGRARRGALRRAGRAPRAARRPRRARDPARRRPRLHGARLPARAARARRHPAGRLRARAVPAVQPRLRAVVRDLRQRHPLRARRADRACPRAGVAGPLRLHVLTDPTPVARLRRYVRLTGLPALLPDVGLRLLEVARRLRAPGGRRGGRPRLPLARHRRSTRSSSTRRGRRNTTRGSPTRTSSRTSPGWSRAGARTGVRTVVWVTPWVNLESLDGQIPPDPGSRRLHREPAPNYDEARSRPSSAAPTASRTSRAGGWARARWSTSPIPEPRRGGARRRCARCAWASRASRPTTARATTCGEDLRFADGTHRGAERLALRRPVPALDAARARRGARPGPRRALRAQRLERPAGDRRAVGGRPGIGLLVAAHAGVLHDRGGGQRLLELVARRRRLPRPARRRALPEGAAACAGCSSAASRRSCRPTAGSSRSRGPTTPRRSRSTAATCCCTRCSIPTCAPRRPAPRAAGRRSCVPPRCWTPAAGRSPMPSASAPRSGSRRSSRRARASARPGCHRGEWIEAWSGAARARRARGARAGAAARHPGVGARGRDRRHPSAPPPSRAGLGEGDAPLHATLWGEPRCGRALARLADGTVVRWRRGRWSAHGRADVTFSER